MKAVCWYGPGKLKVERVPDPEILNPTDAIIEVTAAAVCGSDLHIYDGYIPSVMKGDILGHETVGVVVEVGKEVDNLRVGQRVVVPFPISCGRCWYCQQGLWSLCDNSNPNAWMAEKLWGYSPAGIYGYSHLLGGYAGGQAEYLRVPFADIGPMALPELRGGSHAGRRLPDGLHGRGDGEHPGRRRGRGVRLRAGRPVRHPQRVHARRGARHRHRPVP